MNSKEKFEKFLESLKTDKNATLIENVEKGFQACMEEVAVGVEPTLEEKIKKYQTNFRHRLEDFEAVNLSNFIHEMNSQHIRNMHPNMRDVQKKLVTAWEGIKSLMADWSSKYV